jgi:hypothetical protein
LHGVGGEDLRCLGGDVDALLEEGLSHGGVDLVGRFGSRGADLDGSSGHLASVGGGHLRAAGVVTQT